MFSCFTSLKFCFQFCNPVLHSLFWWSVPVFFETYAGMSVVLKWADRHSVLCSCTSISSWPDLLRVLPAQEVFQGSQELQHMMFTKLDAAPAELNLLWGTCQYFLLANESLGEDGLAVGTFMIWMGLKVITLLGDNPTIGQGLEFMSFLRSFQGCLGDWLSRCLPLFLYKSLLLLLFSPFLTHDIKQPQDWSKLYLLIKFPGVRYVRSVIIKNIPNILPITSGIPWHLGIS